jgi:hypothetical protein
MSFNSTRATALFLRVRRNTQSLFSFTALLVVLAMMAGAGKVQAQANAANYAFAMSNTGSFTDMSSGTTTLIIDNQDDAASVISNIGFDFFLNGTRQTQFSVNSNGSLRFGATAVANTNYDPLGQAGQALVTAYGADQRTHVTNGKVHYKVTGTAPNRVLTVEWLNMQSDFNAGGTADLTYQLRLYETSGVIESVYGLMTMGAAGAADANSNSPQFGFSTGNTVGTVGSITAAQSGVPAPTFSGASATPVNNTYVAGVITALNSTTDGSRVLFSYTPSAPLAPTGLNFTAISATGMTLNWTDNASNEAGFVIYRSTDAVNYSFAGLAAANATNFAPTGLTAATSYQWRVHAYAEGALSAAATGTQATNPAGVVTATASGLWSDPNTWSTGVIPTTNDIVNIASGNTVTIDMAAVAYSISIDGTLQYEQTTARSLTVFSDVTINAGGIFQSNPAGTQTGHTLSLNGNLVNNGTLDFSTNAETAGAGIIFTGTANATFSGTGATTDIRTITMNKGTSSASMVEITVSNFTVRGVTTDTVVGGWLVLTNGTLKLSGTFTATSRTFSAAAYTIPATAGFWLNNPNYTVAGQNGTSTISGLIRFSQGTFNIGTASGNSMSFAAGATVIVEGGAINAAGRFAVAAAANAINYTQTGGTITVCMVGNASTTLGSFDLGTGLASSISMSGGTVICQLAATSIDYRNQGGSGITGVTGGTLQLGNASSGAAKTFNLRGVLPNVVVNNASAGHTAAMSTTLVNYNNISLDITTTPGTTFNFANAVFLFVGNTLTNNGTMTSNGASSTLYMINFSGSLITQTITGTGVFTAPFTNLTAQGSDVSLNNTNQIPVLRCNVLSGGFIHTNKLTIGNGGTGTAIIQYGVAAQTLPVHGFDATPTWSVGTGGMNLFYAQELTGRTTGFEVPPSRMLNVLGITNTNDLTISGGDITIGGTGATNSFSMTTSNVITGTNTIILGTSTTQLGTFSYPAGSGIIIGNFKRWFDATASSKDFPVGIAGAKRAVTINYTTAPTTGGSLSTHWVSLPAGTNGLPLTEGAINVSGVADGYWSITPGDGLTGGSFAGTFTATGIPNITDVTKLVLLQRTNSTSPWTLNGTHVTGSGTPAVPVLARTGMNAFTEFGIGSSEFCNASVASVSSDADNVVCAGEAVTFTANPTNGGTPAYQWNVNNTAVPTATNSTYTSSTLTNSDVVTVVMTAAGNSCFSSPATSSAITMTVNALPTVSGTSNTAALCFGDANGSAIVNANGVGGVTYSWSPGGATTSTVTGLAAGTYSVLITDGNFCSITQTLAVAQPAMLNASSSASSVLCNGGVATVTVDATGGTSAYTGTGVISNVMAGTYTYSVTDANGCTATTSITVTEPSVLTASTSATSILCNGGVATVTVDAMGGTAAYTGTGVMNNVMAGTYTYSVTDANGCMTTTSITVTEPSAISSSTSFTNSTCGNSNGVAEVTANGGTGSLGYAWAPLGGNAATTTGIPSGSYTVTITDANSCSSTAIVSISDIGAPGVVTASVNVSCNGLADGSIDNTVTGGTGSYTYNWSNSGNTEDLNSLLAGTYSYTVTDGAGCSTLGSVTITEPAAIDVTTSTTGNTVTANNATATSYQWVDCDNSNAPIGGETNASFTAPQSGNYAVIINEGSCSATSSCVNVIVTGIKTAAATVKFAVYPNPGTGVYTVSTDAKIARISVMNAQGKVVYQSADNASRVSVDITEQASGVYLFMITTANGTSQQRVVKQ